jgi:hypothetical protein
LICLVYVFYFLFYPAIDLKYDTQNGDLILVNPISLNKQTTISDYATLNNININDSNMNKIEYNYNYAMSFWINIGAILTFSSSAYNENVSILNYNFAPNLVYNPNKNELIIQIREEINANINEDKGRDNNDIKIIPIFVKKDVLLQKWNHIVFQYNGGIVDIFINGVLEKSIDNIIPKMTLGNLDVGQNGGIAGGLCNLVYFKKILSIQEIETLYNTFKNKSPPVPYYSSDKVINRANKFVPYISSGNFWKYVNPLSEDPEPNVIRDPKPDSGKIDINYLSKRWNPIDVKNEHNDYP